jgi:transposase
MWYHTVMKQMAEIKKRFEFLSSILDERGRRLLAAAEALTLGERSIAIVSRATGMSRAVIAAGVAELRGEAADTESAAPGRVRREGGGRKKTTELDPTLVRDLESLVEPVTRGDPQSPLRWTIKSVRRLEEELKKMGHKVSYRTIARMLPEMGYSLQANSKTLEGADHPDRNDQFEYINKTAEEQLDAGNPVISVDTKKKELVGEFKNPGRELRPKGQPEKVQVHDFVQDQGFAIPYGVYDLGRNEGWVSVGVDHDTSTFAVETIRRWWHTMGKPVYPSAQHLYITSDGGGSNGSRVRLWKLELQNLSDDQRQ